jgi:hypothetical protein
MSKNPINKKIISKVVKVSQAIEGYSESNQETMERVKKLRKKYAIKVSAK